MKDTRPGPIIFLFVLIGIIMPVVLFAVGKSGLDRERAYIENGRLVVCEVIASSSPGIQRRITVLYTAENGAVTEAYAISGSRKAVGDVFEAYVLPWAPYEVYSPAGAALKCFFFAVTALLMLGGWLLLILYIVSLKGRRDNE